MKFRRNRRTEARQPGPTTTPDRPAYRRYHVTFGAFTAANGDRHRDLTMTVYGTNASSAIMHAEVLLELDHTPDVDPQVSAVVLADQPHPTTLTLRA